MEKKKNKNLNFFIVTETIRKSYLKNVVIDQLNISFLRKNVYHQGIAISKSRLTRYKQKNIRWQLPNAQF